ncbi:RNA polymerase II large subunit CTD [Penicillium brevicompactum]|uniref:RNA polymerase II large subunit CTD n=1 Tax=Penicillium brevicompactum TaxID=5074 RepID=A0A9W9Q5L9_PENBR|nr:RNA polymerase II large subunit CTD [Penicillium brevicompactum]
MAFTDDAVKAKLSALNETQESIVTVAQWVMFHRRHAERTGQIWLSKIRDSPPPKRLNLIYLANEVAQQSKARGKDDFLIAFSPIIVEATSAAYKGASHDYQQRIRRVVEVWRQRNVFEGPILDAVESRIDEIDKTRSTTKKQTLGGSFFKDASSGSTPSELQPLVPLQVALSKAAVGSNSSTATATSEFNKLHDPNAPQPTLPVHAARLSQLLKSLANAENSVSEVIKSRRALIDGLEKILQTNRAELSKEEAIAADLAQKKESTDTKKREVEDAILSGMSNEDTSAGPENTAHNSESARPEVEALTPPPVEAITPVGSPQPEKQGIRRGPFTDDADDDASEWTVLDSTSGGDGAGDSSFPKPQGQENGNDFDITNGPKRRKISHGEEDYAAFAGGDLDPDLAALLTQPKQ